jgi:sodium/proline symporter
VIPQLEGKESLALAIFALIIIAYTFSGGFKAVCWTDFFQGIMMLVALLSIPIIILVANDTDSANLSFTLADGTLNSFNPNPFSASWQDIISGLGWGLGYFGMPHILVRFMSIKKPSMIKKSATVAIIWVVLSLGAAIAIAILGRTYLLGGTEALAAKLLPGSTQQMVFVTIVNSIFPSFIAGILLAAIIAASMSTADSQLLVASSAFSSDFYQPIVRKNKATDAEMLWVGRFIVMIVAFVAFYIAASGIGKPGSWASSIMDMVENAWGLFGAAFGPVVILSLFWRRFNYAGALAGIVGGALVDIICLYNLKGWLGGTYLYEIVPGFVAGFAIAVIATLLTKKPGQEVDAIFEKATAA